VVLLAVPDPSPLALQRAAALAGGHPVETVIFAPETEAGLFDPWGRPVAEAWERRPLEWERFDRHVRVLPDPAAQAVLLADLAARPDRIPGALALGVGDPDVAPLLENELRRRDVAVFNPDGRRMRGEALFELLRCLAALVRDPSFESVAALARCPDFLAAAGFGPDAEAGVAGWLAGLDDLRARHLPADLDAARAFAAGGRRFSAVAGGLEVMAGLRTQLTGGSFAAGASAALRGIFSGRVLDPESPADARWREAALAWSGILRECAAAEERFGRLPVADGWELALRLFGEIRCPDRKPAGAVELQGWLEVLWEDAPHLVVAGLNDGRVPESLPEDGFLPPGLRVRLGLPTEAMRSARDAYFLQAIASSREHVGQLDLLVGRSSAAGDPLRPSRLLLRCTDAGLPGRIAHVFRVPPPAEAAPSWTRAWKLHPHRLPPLERVSVTALRGYLQCPFRFFLRHGLKMDVVDPAKSELDALDFGTLCHSALEQIGRDPGLKDCTDAATLREGLLGHLDRTVRNRFGKLLALPLLVQLESARQRLGKLAELQAAERAAGWEIIDVERSFEVEVSGLRVRGKIDRIDRHAETGATRVLDYKTSDRPANPADTHLRNLRSDEVVPEWARLEDAAGRSRVWVDLQLPLYLRALAAELPGRPACGYFNLPKAVAETALACWEDYDREQHAAAMRCAEGVCAAIRRGEFWPPDETIKADRDEFGALFHHGAAASVEWPEP
jgi:ATP-dependent helicase/nuclease subunit B